MINTDEDSLICDLAETYGIYDMETFPLGYVAVLACGLRDNSRIMLTMSESRVSTETLLLASAVDQLNFIAWSKTEDAQHGDRRPQSIVNALLFPQEKETESFTSAEEFEEMRRQLLGV
jgi:hypothetical protein